MSEVVPLIGRYGMIGWSMEMKKKLINFVIFDLAKFAIVNQYGRIGDKNGVASQLIFPVFITQPAHERLSKLIYTRN